MNCAATNELGWQPRGPYIEESTCVSQPMIGANVVGLIAPCLKQSYAHSLEMNPRIP